MAFERGTDRLEDEAHRRAIHGVTKPIMYKGKVVTTVQEHSDTLLQTMLKAHRPRKFVEHDPNVAQPPPPKEPGQNALAIIQKKLAKIARAQQAALLPAPDALDVTSDEE